MWLPESRVCQVAVTTHRKAIGWNMPTETSLAWRQFRREKAGGDNIREATRGVDQTTKGCKLYFSLSNMWSHVGFWADEWYDLINVFKNLGGCCNNPGRIQWQLSPEWYRSVEILDNFRIGISWWINYWMWQEDLGITLRFLSWTTRRLNLQSTEIWKKQTLGEDQKFNFEPDRFDLMVRCA